MEKFEGRRVTFVWSVESLRGFMIGVISKELKHGDYSRENLIAICEAAIVNVDNWSNRDTPGAQIAVGKCWALLKAGCNFQVRLGGSGGCVTDERTIWLDIQNPSFNTFEYGEGYEEEDMFYLPTPARLGSLADGSDWY